MRCLYIHGGLRCPRQVWIRGQHLCLCKQHSRSQRAADQLAGTTLQERRALAEDTTWDTEEERP